MSDLYGPIEVPGTDVRAYLYKITPNIWSYGLWTGPDDADLVSSGRLDVPAGYSPAGVARIAFILDVEYGGR